MYKVCQKHFKCFMASIVAFHHTLIDATYPFRDLRFPFPPQGNNAQITNGNVCVRVWVSVRQHLHNFMAANST